MRTMTRIVMFYARACYKHFSLQQEIQHIHVNMVLSVGGFSRKSTSEKVFLNHSTLLPQTNLSRHIIIYSPFLFLGSPQGVNALRARERNNHLYIQICARIAFKSIRYTTSVADFVLQINKSDFRDNRHITFEIST